MGALSVCPPFAAGLSFAGASSAGGASLAGGIVCGRGFSGTDRPGIRPARQVTTCRARPAPEFDGGVAIRIFLFVVLAGLVALAGGALMLGAFPPQPHPQSIEKVLPNDKFGQHG